MNRALLRTICGMYIIATVLFLPACREPSEVTTEAAADNSRTWDYERGPLRLSVSVDREELSIAERLELDLVATIDDGYTLTMPILSPDATEFAIVDIIDARPVLQDDGVVRQSRTYELEPFLSGEYTIPELLFLFQETDGVKDPHELLTEAISIQVNSLLPEDLAELSLRDVSGPVAPGSTRNILFAVIGASILLIAIGAFIIIRKLAKRRQRESLTYIAAHDVAFDALEALIADDLLGKGEIARFYVRVSGILRRYIENRFGIHAPEQTTEEFLFVAKKSGVLNEKDRASLDTFLTHCDLVKFAEFKPKAAEIQATFDSCRDFIESTRNSDVKIVATEEA